MDTMWGQFGSGPAVVGMTSWVLVGALNAWLARRKGRSAFTWFWLSSWVGLLGSAFLVIGDRARPLQRGFDVPGTRSDGRLVPERVALVVAAVASVLTSGLTSWQLPVQLGVSVLLLAAWGVLVWRRKVAERRTGLVAEA